MPLINQTKERKDEWATCPFQAIILSGMGGRDNSQWSDQWVVLPEEMLRVQCQAHLSV